MPIDKSHSTRCEQSSWKMSSWRRFYDSTAAMLHFYDADDIRHGRHKNMTAYHRSHAARSQRSAFIHYTYLKSEYRNVNGRTWKIERQIVTDSDSRFQYFYGIVPSNNIIRYHYLSAITIISMAVLRACHSIVFNDGLRLRRCNVNCDALPKATREIIPRATRMKIFDFIPMQKLN